MKTTQGPNAKLDTEDMKSGLYFVGLTFEEMLHEAKLREPDDELRVLAEAAESRVKLAYDEGWEEGYEDGLNKERL